MSVIDSRTAKELRGVLERLDGFANTLKKEQRKFLEYAAVPVIEEAQKRAPKSIRVHFRYSTPKVIGKMRAKKGFGVKVAEYRPGNLQGSVRILRLRRAKAVYVGPQVASNAKGSFGPNRPDGYYAHMVEFGTSQSAARPFMRPAAMAAQSEVKRRIETSVRFLAKKYAKETGL